MRIVVTRPQRSGEKTAATLTALGHKPIHLALFEPFYRPEATKHALSKTVSAIAVTSGEALRALEPLRGALVPHLAKPLFAVGEATAKAARRAGFQNVLVADGNGKALARLISENRDLFCKKAPVLYLAGTLPDASLRSGAFKGCNRPSHR